MNAVCGVASVVGRVLLVAIFFLAAAADFIPRFSGTVNTLAKEGAPFPGLMIAGAAAFLLVGSVSIIVGYQARTGAGLLLVFLVLATYYFHDFWNFDDPKEQMIHFMKNVALMGAMIFLMANGAGKWSLDNRGKESPG